MITLENDDIIFSLFYVQKLVFVFIGKSFPNEKFEPNFECRGRKS
jgi:hypothetical protein